MTTNKPDYNISPLGLRTNLLFAALVSLFFLILGSFPESNFIQWINRQTTPAASRVLGFIPLPVWMLMALFIGIYIPLLMLILYQFRKWLNALLLPYLIVYMIQIITELILTKIVFPGFALLAGIIYTAYRIWQLQTAISIHNQRATREDGVHVFLQNYLMLAAGFWMLNLFFLLSVFFT